jgi:hypothetical protein
VKIFLVNRFSFFSESLEDCGLQSIEVEDLALVLQLLNGVIRLKTIKKARMVA